jgi:hypothetical protein
MLLGLRHGLDRSAFDAQVDPQFRRVCCSVVSGLAALARLESLFRELLVHVSVLEPNLVHKRPLSCLAGEAIGELELDRAFCPPSLASAEVAFCGVVQSSHRRLIGLSDFGDAARVQLFEHRPFPVRKDELIQLVRWLGLVIRRRFGRVLGRCVFSLAAPICGFRV